MGDANDSSGGGYQKLPPGWDCKYDQATGNCYYINYLTKAMQLEDPRADRGYKQLQNERCSTESIALQHMVAQQQQQQHQQSHNSSPYHVYPSNSLTAVRAFQERNQLPPSLHNISSSPLLSTSSRGHLEMSSPLPFQRGRVGNMSRRSTIQETSFSNQIDTDVVVGKIQNMFPTAGENHIRLLLKRYYNREAVVISALQVEKHPVTMPGPFVTPPAQRHLYHSNSAFYMTPPARRLDMGASRGALSSNSRTASPLPGGRFGSLISMQSGPGQGQPLLHGSPLQQPQPLQLQWRSSPKPHSSPKMKLRYMKNIFPKADEMLLLDVLANADNNVQFASEKLISLGYTKRDMQQHKPNNRPPQLEPGQQLDDAPGVQHIPLRPKEYTAQEKTNMETLLKQKYPQIAERIILMALESVNYAEDRATQILQIVHEEDEQHAQKHAMPLESALLQNSIAEQAATEQVDGLAADSILTVVVETTPTDTAAAATKPHKQHQQQRYNVLPSINVTTPTTATTQIILSHLPALDNETEAEAEAKAKPSQAEHIIASPLSPISTASCNSSATHSYVSPAQSPMRKRYERLTTKSMLTQSSGGGGVGGSCSTNFKSSNNNKSNNFSISGYLHGSGCNSNASSYSSYSTSMTSSSLATANSNFSSITSKLTSVDSRTRIKSDSLNRNQHVSTCDNFHNSESAEFQSLIERMASLGPNSQLSKGADEKLLLADYVTWNGPNTALTQKQATHGADATLLTERSYKPVGRNVELCKGAKAGLAKGSIYAQGSSNSANIKCN